MVAVVDEEISRREATADMAEVAWLAAVLAILRTRPKSILLASLER